MQLFLVKPHKENDFSICHFENVSYLTERIERRAQFARLDFSHIGRGKPGCDRQGSGAKILRLPQPLDRIAQAYGFEQFLVRVCQRRTFHTQSNSTPE